VAGEDRYRLAPVRETRERTERVKRGELASAVDETRDAEAQVAAIHARAAGVRRRLSALEPAGPALVPASELANAERYRSRLRGELAAIAGELERAEAVLSDRTDVADTARGSLARARADREVIERHFARWRETQRKAAERRED
jgi:flagellar export protein FliJ